MSECAAFKGALAIEIHIAAHLGFVAGVLGFVEVVRVRIIIILLIIIFCFIKCWLRCDLGSWSKLIFNGIRGLHFRLTYSVIVYFILTMSESAIFSLALSEFFIPLA
jgi:hypothetical protein